MKAVRKPKTGQRKRIKSELRVAQEITRRAWQPVIGADEQIAEWQSVIADAEERIAELRRSIEWAQTPGLNCSFREIRGKSN